MDSLAPYNSVLCHYTTARTAFEHIVPTGRLMLSPYERMRDPMETQPWRMGGSMMLDESQSGAIADKAFFKAYEEMERLRTKAKLAALTIDAAEYEQLELHESLYGRGWARARMWEQYGDTHRGVCLVFDREALVDAFSTQSQDPDVDFFLGEKVRYTPAGTGSEHSARNMDLASFMAGDTKAAAKAHLATFARELLFTKTRDWEAEHEFRFVLTTESVGFEFLEFGSSLKAVIVGSDFPQWQVRGASQVCEQSEAELLRIRWFSEGPWLVDAAKEPDGEDST